MSNEENKIFIPKSAAIIGAGKSGLSAAKYFKEQGIDIFISDSCGIDELNFRLAANDLSQIAHEGEGHTNQIFEYEIIVISPGVPTNIPIVQKAKKSGIPVWSEIELAYRICKAPFLAVTGSTGKSTTVSILGKIMEAAGKTAPVIGNIGLPAISMVPSLNTTDFAVIEVSSFQLENIDQFKPQVACITNLLANHLDRYNSMDEYIAVKREITRNMKQENFLILNAIDAKLRTWADELQQKTKVVLFSDKEEPIDSVWYSGSTIFVKIDGFPQESINIEDMKLSGDHNKLNSCAAGAMAILAGCGTDAVREGICSFTGLPHRLEYVAEIDNVKYYNDSKATTAESVESAIRAFNTPVHLIAGGKDKGCDFAAINNAVRNKVSHLYLIGSATKRIQQTWKGLTEIHKCSTLEDAVHSAQNIAEKGEVVLLSPACSSFDMFKNFEHRGEVFKEIVNNLKSKNVSGD